MVISTIHVQHRDGSPARHVRVVIGFSGGMTSPAYTDDRGDVQVSHPSVGRASVYVSGREYHEFHAPGRTSVTV